MSREIAGGGRSSQNCSGGVHGGGARQVFGEMPGWVESSVGAGLHVFVSHVLYPVTNEVLHQVYDIHEATAVQMLATTNAGHVEALVWFRMDHDAEQARCATHRRNIYDGCCLLDIQHMHPLPCAGAGAMTIKCATMGLSPDDGMVMATATPIAVALGPPTASATSTTTHVQVATPPTQDAEDEVYEPLEEPKETVQELCAKILATLNRMLKGSRNTIPDATSPALGADLAVAMEYPCSSTTSAAPVEQKVALEAASTKHGSISDLPKATPIKYSTSVPDVSVDTNLVAGVLLPMTDTPQVIAAPIGNLVIESSIHGADHLDTDIPTVARVKCLTFFLDVNDDTDLVSKAFMLTTGLWYNPNAFEVFHGTSDKRRMEMCTGFWEFEFFSNGAEVRQPWPPPNRALIRDYGNDRINVSMLQSWPFLMNCYGEIGFLPLLASPDQAISEKNMLMGMRSWPENCNSSTPTRRHLTKNLVNLQSLLVDSILEISVAAHKDGEMEQQAPWDPGESVLQFAWSEFLQMNHNFVIMLRRRYVVALESYAHEMVWYIGGGVVLLMDSEDWNLYGIGDFVDCKVDLLDEEMKPWPNWHEELRSGGMVELSLTVADQVEWKTWQFSLAIVDQLLECLVVDQRVVVDQTWQFSLSASIVLIAITDEFLAVWWSGQVTWTGCSEGELIRWMELKSGNTDCAQGGTMLLHLFGELSENPPGYSISIDLHTLSLSLRNYDKFLLLCGSFSGSCLVLVVNCIMCRYCVAMSSCMLTVVSSGRSRHIAVSSMKYGKKSIMQKNSGYLGFSLAYGSYTIKANVWSISAWVLFQPWPPPIKSVCIRFLHFSGFLTLVAVRDVNLIFHRVQ